MKEFLNSFTAAHRNPSFDECKSYEAVFSGAIHLARTALEERAFRPERFINAAVFDSVMVGLATRLSKGRVLNVHGISAAYEQLIDNEDYKSAYLRSTADEESVAVRMRLAIRAFSDCE